VKLALVTGGFRRIGAAIAARLAGEGWALALHSHTPTAPEADLGAMLLTNNTAWHGFDADLVEPTSAAHVLDRITAHFGAVPSLIINNASRFVYDDAATIDAAAIAERMAINLTTPVLFATELAKRLPPGEQGCVINILDQRIRQPNGDQLSYTLSKQALAGATETLARALAPHVRVNGIAPGLTLPTDDYRPAQMVALAQAMPLQLLPEPDDLADAVLFLAGARATTGQILFVDGGAALKSFERDFVFMA
jgi:pteridine reductase